MMTYIEQKLIDLGDRILLVETSGLDEFKRTRSFYSSCNYTLEGRIRDFYAAGDDKIIFWKKLS